MEPTPDADGVIRVPGPVSLSCHSESLNRFTTAHAYPEDVRYGSMWRWKNFTTRFRISFNYQLEQMPDNAQRDVILEIIHKKHKDYLASLEAASQMLKTRQYNAETGVTLFTDVPRRAFEQNHEKSPRQLRHPMKSSTRRSFSTSAFYPSRIAGLWVAERRGRPEGCLRFLRLAWSASSHPQRRPRWMANTSVPDCCGIRG